MSGGDTHAKRLVIKQAEELSEKITKSKEINQQTIGEAFLLITEMITPLYLYTFRTAEECDDLRGSCPCLEEVKEKQGTSQQKYQIKLGPMTWHGSLSNVAIAFLFFLYLVGKNKGWW